MTVLLAVLAAAVPSGCHREFTVRTAARGIRATYHGDRPLGSGARRRIRRYLACTSTNAHGYRYLRSLARRQRHAHRLRVLDAAVTPYGRWAIPEAIVMCESRGENLAPNADGASGYYQIIPGTWTAFGGSGPAAYLVPKAEQDAVAARIWDGGAGASQWVCAGLVGW